MNALASYRQSRKMGWSRPQNKYGLTVFESFRMNPTNDHALIDFAMQTLLKEFPELDEESSRFVREVHQDARLIGFIFVHDSQDQGKKYEGITFSFGRVAAGQTQNRDRVDLIVESEISGGLCPQRTIRIDPTDEPVLFEFNMCPSATRNDIPSPARGSLNDELRIGAAFRHLTIDDPSPTRGDTF